MMLVHCSLTIDPDNSYTFPNADYHHGPVAAEKFHPFQNIHTALHSRKHGIDIRQRISFWAISIIQKAETYLGAGNEAEQEQADTDTEVDK